MPFCAKGPPQRPTRAVRYRRLALSERNKDRAALLLKLAEEPEQNVLWTVDRLQQTETQRPRTRIFRSAGGHVGGGPAPHLRIRVISSSSLDKSALCLDCS
jgi:hypothetical protein